MGDINQGGTSATLEAAAKAFYSLLSKHNVTVGYSLCFMIIARPQNIEIIPCYKNCTVLSSQFIYYKWPIDRTIGVQITTDLKSYKSILRKYLMLCKLIGTLFQYRQLQKLCIPVQTISKSQLGIVQSFRYSLCRTIVKFVQ